eukprot:1149145-Pelagomonas_calceolata.AAC.6
MVYCHGVMHVQQEDAALLATPSGLVQCCVLSYGALPWYFARAARGCSTLGHGLWPRSMALQGEVPPSYRRTHGSQCWWVSGSLEENFLGGGGKIVS